MEFNYFDNSDAIVSHFQAEVHRYADPAPVSIINAVPYITVLEYGGVFIYNRKTKNRKLGIFRHPKGGMSMREAFTTTVIQPPKAMVGQTVYTAPYAMTRRTRRVITNTGIRLCRLNRPKGTNDLRTMLLKMAMDGLTNIRALTPVDEDIARQGWLLKP